MAASLGCHNSVLNQICVSRDEATRTPDPYVPNVVRYQLRYIPIPARLKPSIAGQFSNCRAKVLQNFELRANFPKFFSTTTLEVGEVGCC